MQFRAMLFGLLAGAVFTATAADPSYTPAQALEKFQRFTLSDGASYYSFAKAGGFSSGPMGMSGRELKGTWQDAGDKHFTVVAEEGWMNGISQPGNFRRMVFVIYDVHPREIQPEVRTGLPGNWDLFDGYFFIEEVSIIVPPSAPTNKTVTPLKPAAPPTPIPAPAKRKAGVLAGTGLVAFSVLLLAAGLALLRTLKQR